MQSIVMKHPVPSAYTDAGTTQTLRFLTLTLNIHRLSSPWSKHKSDNSTVLWCIHNSPLLGRIINHRMPVHTVPHILILSSSLHVSVTVLSFLQLKCWKDLNTKLCYNLNTDVQILLSDFTSCDSRRLFVITVRICVISVSYALLNVSVVISCDTE